MWLICKNSSGTIWQINEENCGASKMFTSRGELLYVVASYSYDYSYIEVDKIMFELRRTSFNKKYKAPTSTVILICIVLGIIIGELFKLL